MTVNSESSDWRLEEALNRFQMISRLINEDLEPADRAAIIKKIAEENQVSIRSIQRYYKSYKENGLVGLMPEPRGHSIGANGSERFQDQLNQAIILLRENPKRPVRMLIKTLVLEGKAEAGEIPRSTLQRHLYEKGYGKVHLKEASDPASNRALRWCKAHRMELVQTDFKYSISLNLEEGNGHDIKVYLCTQLDDHSRFALKSTWYLHQTAESVEDSLKQTILRYGLFNSWYCDNGTQFNTTFITKVLAKLGIKKLNCKPYRAQAKGKIEKYHQVVNYFLSEVPLHADKIRNLEDLNRFWTIFLDQYYLNDPHGGIAEYYKQNNLEYPKEGITPVQEFNRDTRELKFADASYVAEVFLHEAELRVRNGTVKFDGKIYKADVFGNGSKVTAFYDPFHKESITLRQDGMKDYISRPIAISEYIDFEMAAKNTKLPQFTPNGTSRVLDSMEKAFNEKNEKMTRAISFFDLMNEGENNE